MVTVGSLDPASIRETVDVGTPALAASALRDSPASSRARLTSSPALMLLAYMQQTPTRSVCFMERIGYVILYVGDLEVAVGFYRDVVGLEYKFTDAGYAEFEAGGVRFALYERRRAEWLTGRDVVPGAGGEVVVMVDDVDAWADRLAARGVPVLSGPADRPWGHRTVHVADPDGFVVEFAQEIPRARGRQRR